MEGLAAFPSLQLFTGNIPVEEEFREIPKNFKHMEKRGAYPVYFWAAYADKRAASMPNGPKIKGLLAKTWQEKKNGLKIGDKNPNGQRCGD